MQVLVRPAAAADIEDAFLWYEQQRPGLGADFLRTVDGALAAIQSSPQLHAVIHRNTRRAYAAACQTSRQKKSGSDPEMKGPARGRGLGARLSGRRLAGRLLHPRGRDRGEPAGQKGQVSRQVAGNPTAAAGGAAARAGSLLM